VSHPNLESEPTVIPENKSGQENVSDIAHKKIQEDPYEKVASDATRAKGAEKFGGSTTR